MALLKRYFDKIRGGIVFTGNRSGYLKAKERNYIRYAKGVVCVYC